MIIIDKETGLEYEILKRGGVETKEPTHIIGNLGDIQSIQPYSAPGFTRLRLIRKQHTFGGVVFEETGEWRRCKKGEPWLNDVKDGAYLGNSPSPHEVTILKAVSIEE